MIPLLLALLAPALALTPEEVLAEVRALDSLRSQRIAAAPRIPDSAYLTAAKGTVAKAVIAAEGADTGKAYGVLVSSLGIDALWKAVNDEPHLVGYMPITDSVVVGGTTRGSNATVFQFLEVPVPGVANRWWVTRVRFNPGLYASSDKKMWELYWKEDFSVSLEGTPQAARAADGIPLAFTQGAWLLLPLSDGRTVMEYYVWSNPGGAVPAWVANRLGGGAIVDTFKGVERMVRDHIASCPGPYYYPDGSKM